MAYEVSPRFANGITAGYQTTVVQSGPLAWLSTNRALALLGAGAVAFLLGHKSVGLTLAAVGGALMLLDAQPVASSAVTVSAPGVGAVSWGL